jgi:glycosyltransferase involved in cell wall biosynthesis
MRIGFDARLIYYQQAGIGQYILQLVQSLARIETRHELWVFRSRKAPPLPLPAHIHQAKLWTPSHHRFESTALSAELMGKRLDLLHSPDFIPPFGGRFRSVITIHDLNFIHFPEFLTPKSTRYYEQIYRAVERADHVIVDSNWTKNDVIQELNVAAERITTIHLAADSVYRPITDRQEIRHTMVRYGLPSDFIIFVGTLEPRKNIPSLLKALYHLHSKGYDIHLAIVGRKGWLYEDVFETLTELKLTDFVHFLENVPNQDLARLYNAAQCLVLPSYFEGFGLPPLEAMACGTPVVVSDRASLPEVVGDAGLLIDPTSPQDQSRAIAQILDSETLRKALRQKGLIRANKFSWTKAAHQTMAVYQKVLQAAS